MRRSGLVWTPATLDRFIAAAMRLLPGSSMTYAGVPEAQHRADLIAYLQGVDRSTACRR
jgi:cytochrome c